MHGSHFPVIWWLWWFIAAFAIYGILALWFWRASRQTDQDAPQGQPQDHTPQA